jgi:hypothetical protein
MFWFDMKKLLLIAVLVLEIITARAQNNSVANELDQKILAGVFNKPGAGNDRQAWSGYFSGLLNMVGTDGKSSIQLSTTLFALRHFRQYAKGDSLVAGETFRKEKFLRSLQINAGFTPDSKQQVQVDAISYGLKYAVINNKALNKKEISRYNAAFKSYYQTVWEPFNKLVQHYIYTHPGDSAAIFRFERSNGKLPIATLPPEFLATLMEQTNIKKQDSLNYYFSVNGMAKALLADLKTKPTLTFSANSNYNELKSQTNNVVFSSNLIFYGSRTDTLTQYTITANYTLGADTTKQHSSLVRNIAELDFGPNFSFKKVKWLELKTSLDLINTLGPLYSKENKNTANLSVTPRVEINKNFWLPVTFKYNAFQKNAHVQGQLSVQYSLK